MYESILAVLLLLALTALGIEHWRVVRERRAKSQAIAEILHEEQEIVEEELRLFEFLHNLGEAIAREDNQASIYRLIVEGAAAVLKCPSGALYLLDAAERNLVPRHVMENCLPLSLLPARSSAQGSLLSQMRLLPLPAQEGLLGEVLRAQRVECLDDLSADARTAPLLQAHHLNGGAALIGALVSGSRRLGVLVVCCPQARQFSDNDRQVFSSLVEQSAFALANAMAHQAAAEKRRIEAELRAASDIQRILLPANPPQIAGWKVAGRNRAARVLSGDSFDYVSLADGSTAVSIADVSGKGTAAALIMAMSRTALRMSLPDAAGPAAALAAVNQQLYPDIQQDMFITMICLMLRVDGHLRLARAGHTKPLLWRSAGDEVQVLQSGGLAVGIDKGAVFERVTKDLQVELQSGDLLLLYTDGVNEAQDSLGEEFGEQRIIAAMHELAPRGPQALVDGLIERVDAFCEGRRGHDDITLVALQKS
jgi:sigma-B regulation protein RsbU (phosphoserine phosphatase)